MELWLLVAQLRSKRDDSQSPFSPDSLGRGVGSLGDEYDHGGGLFSGCHVAHTARMEH
jgi:hypothetical protein